jgi:hypothetical protein
MARLKLNIKAMKANSIAATNAIEIGGIYFLSSFYDKDGATVKVLSKSTKMNSAGWPSSVEIEVIEPLGGEIGKSYYAAGVARTVNASNLYKNRADASHTAKYGGVDGEAKIVNLVSLLSGVSPSTIRAITGKSPAAKAWATRRARAAQIGA